MDTLSTLSEHLAERTFFVEDYCANYKPQLLLAYRIRKVETTFLELFAKGKLNGTVHTCVGQEFSAVAVCSQLAETDWVTSNHRCHGHFIVKTNAWTELIDELMGLETGVCKGIGSSQHLFKQGFVSNGPQGALLPIGTGMAHFLDERKDGIVVSFIGEGTLGEGVTYEALNMASLFGVPQLFVCENNYYSQSTSQDHNTAGSIRRRFEAFDIETYEADTWDLDTLFSTTKSAIERCRTDRKPKAIVIHTYRLNAHSKGDDDREPSELELFKQHDILDRIISTGLLEEEFGTIDKEIEAYVSRDSNPGALSIDTYNKDQLPRKSGMRLSAVVNRDSRVIDEINGFLHEEAAGGALMVGEDISDPYGGAFKATKGISSQHPNQVVSTPISEAGLVGFATGYAMMGGTAYAEIMFGDFVTYAFDQIMNCASKFFGMYGFQVSAPVRIRTPMGGGRGYGPTHSQSLEKYLCGADNLLVLALNSIQSPADVYKELKPVECPAIIIENKTGYGRKLYQPHRFLEVNKRSGAFGELIIQPKYNLPHVTLCSYGETARFLLDNYEQIFAQCDAVFEVYCLTKLHPLDVTHLYKGICRTGHLLVVEDGSVDFGIGAEIVAKVTEMGFTGRVGRIGAEPVPIPSPRSLEDQCLVNVDKVVSGVTRILQ